MAKEIGKLNVVVGLDSTGFQNGIGHLNREMKKVQSEFRLASSEMGKHGKALDGLKLKSTSLTKQTQLQRQKVDALRQAHQQSVETKGRDAKATQDLEIKLNNAQAKLSSMEQSLSGLNKEIALQSSGFYKLSQALAPVGAKMQEVGQKMAVVGKDLTKKLTLPLVAVGAAATKVGLDFEAGMSEVAAISGATGHDLKKLEEKAKEMGATTKFSATESAEALKYMAMAGWDTNQMVDGLDGVMMLAAASGENLGSVSDIVTDALTAFGMEARDASDFADLLASASSNSNTNVALLGESFKHVAPLFGAVGYSSEDAALALGLMANAGIKGSQAGTSLKTALANLTNPTASMQTAMTDLGLSITDASGEMLPFKDVMDQLREKFSGLTEEQKAQQAATIFGKEAMSGMLAIINASDADYQKLTGATRDYTGAAKEMADTMEGNLQGGVTKLKSALEGVGIQIFQILLPHLQSLVEKIQTVVEWFANLSPATQETIVKLALVAAAIGPLLVIGGKLIAGIGSIISVVSTVTGAIAVVTTGAAAATPAIGALAAVFTVLTGPVGLAIAAIAALTVAGVALYKHLNQDSIPEIQLFGDEVSEATQQAVGGFLELNDQATISLNQLAWSGQEVTQEMASQISGNFSQMATDIQAGLDSHHQASLAKIEGFVNNSTTLSQAEQEQILNNMNEGYESRKQKVADGEARIKEILETASTEKRGITKAEQEEINAIQTEMVETGINVLSENEVEAKSIMERMKAQAGDITAKQAAEVVKNSVEQKDKTIQAANEQYDEVVKEIIRQRDEAGTITAEQADKLIKEATRQKDETVMKAEEMHQNVVDEAKTQAKDHVNQVDWETGEVKTKWQEMKTDISEKAKSIKDDVKNKWEEIKTDSSTKWESIKTDTANKWKSMKTDISEKTKSIKDDVRNKWEEIKKDSSQKWKNIKTDTANKWQSMKTDIAKKIKSIKDDVKTKWGEIKTDTQQKLENIKSDTARKWQSMKTDISEKIKSIKENVKTKWSEIKTDTQQKLESIKTDTANKWQSIKTDTANKVSEIKTKVASKWGEIKTDTQQKWESIKSTISEKAGNIKSKIVESITNSESQWVQKTASMLTAANSKFSAMASKVSTVFSTVVSSIKSGIDKLLEWNRQRVEDKKATFTTIFKKITQKITQFKDHVTGNYSGTSFFQGGLTMVGELGPELVELPRGSRIYNDHTTKQMMGGGKGITQNIVINSPQHLSPYETARKIKNASRELAMQW